MLLVARVQRRLKQKTLNIINTKTAGIADMARMVCRKESGSAEED
jgi:hypothetical protein